MITILDVLSFYGIICIGVLAFLAISIFSYVYAKKNNAQNPGTFSDLEIKKRRNILIVASVICAILYIIAISFIILVGFSIANM